MLGITRSTTYFKIPTSLWVVTHSYENGLNKISKIAQSIFTHSREIMGGTARLVIPIQFMCRNNSYPVLSSNLITKTALLYISILWAGRYSVQAQPTFMETLGGVGDDYAYALMTTPDGGIITNGRTTSFGAGGYDILFTKWWNNGTLAWAKTLGGGSDDQGLALTTTLDEGIISGGYASSFGAGGEDVLLSKLWNNGTLAWTKTLGGINVDVANALITASDGGIITSGYTNSLGEGGYDVLLSKWWNNGTLVWAKTLGGTGTDFAVALTVASDEGIIASGLTNSFGIGNHDILLSKWWNNGTLAWAKTLGGINVDVANFLTTTSDGGIVIGGYTTSFGAGDNDALIAKWWNNGTLAWAKTLGGVGFDGAYALTTTSDGGIIMGGTTTSFGAGGYDFLLSKWWNNGTLAWTKTLGGTGSDGANALTTTSDGGIIVGGTTTSFSAGDIDILLAKLTSDGEMSSCSYLQSVVPEVSDIAATISVTTPSATALSWSSPTVKDWNSATINTISPTLLQQCIPTSTTGIATTGQATTGAMTTGIATTGQATTGAMTTGIATTGVLTTGAITTGKATTGVMTTGIATTGVLTTGTITTGRATTGVMTTGIATTGVLTTGTITTGQATTGLMTTGIVTTGVVTTSQVTTGVMTTGTFGSPSASSASSFKGEPPQSRKPADLGLILGLVFGIGSFAVALGGAAGFYLWRRRKNALQESNLELQSSNPPPSSPTHEYQNADSTAPASSNTAPYGVATAATPYGNVQRTPYENVLGSSMTLSGNNAPYGMAIVVDPAQVEQQNIYENMLPSSTETTKFHTYENIEKSSK